MPDKIEPVPGDPSTEPVATAAQSHVAGRVGPPTIAQDADADAFVPEGVAQIEPGTVLPANTPWEGGPLPVEDADGEQGVPSAGAEPMAMSVKPVDGGETRKASSRSGAK